MDSPDDPVDAPDAPLLRALFPPEGGFRHKMGLQRREFHEFYAPTAAGPAIRREKGAILASNPTLYAVLAEEGCAAFGEFAAMLGHPDAPGQTPLAAACSLSLQIEPDFLLVRPPDWTLAWASVCFPSHWSLEGKLRLPLWEIHAAVPGLNDGLGRKITTFFERMAPGEGWGRANWGLSASARRNQHPRLSGPSLAADTPPEATFLRVEDQHLLKLPRTGALAFGIRIFSFRLSEVARDASIAAALKERLATMPPDVANYKGLTRFLASRQTA